MTVVYVSVYLYLSLSLCLKINCSMLKKKPTCPKSWFREQYILVLDTGQRCSYSLLWFLIAICEVLIIACVSILITNNPITHSDKNTVVATLEMMDDLCETLILCMVEAQASSINTNTVQLWKHVCKVTFSHPSMCKNNTSRQILAFCLVSYILQVNFTWGKSHVWIKNRAHGNLLAFRQSCDSILTWTVAAYSWAYRLGNVGPH